MAAPKLPNPFADDPFGGGEPRPRRKPPPVDDGVPDSPPTRRYDGFGDLFTSEPRPFRGTPTPTAETDQAPLPPKPKSTYPWLEASGDVGQDQSLVGDFGPTQTPAPDADLKRKRAYGKSLGEVPETQRIDNIQYGSEIAITDRGGPDHAKTAKPRFIRPNEWRERLLLRASFRGIEFEIETWTIPVGRRTVVHEYPQRDEVFVEDAGRVTRAHRISAFVIGDDYDVRRNALVVALEQAGPGELIHPYLGKRQVCVTEPCSLTEAVVDQRIAKFDLTFVDVASAIGPIVVEDTPSQAFDSASLSRFVANGSWLRKKSVLDTLTTTVTRDYLDIEDSTSKAMALALGAAFDILNLPEEVTTTIAEMFDAARLLAAILYIPTAGPLMSEESQEPARALSTWVKTEILSRCVEIVLGTDYDTREASVFAATSVLDAIKVEERAATDPEVYENLVDMRIWFAKAMLDLGRRLPRVRQLHLDYVIPSHVLSYSIYETPYRADEIVRRNAIEHPLFISGDIEVTTP